MFPIFNVEFNEALKKYNSYNKVKLERGNKSVI